MGELRVTHGFGSTSIKIHIQPNKGDKIVLRENGSHSFVSPGVNQIVVTIQGFPKHCYVTLPSASDLILKPIEGVNVKLIIIKSKQLYISNPPPKWGFTITIPEVNGLGENVTIGDEETY